MTMVIEDIDDDDNDDCVDVKGCFEETWQVLVAAPGFTEQLPS